MIFYLQKTVDFIDENVNKPLNLDIISKEIGFSKFYLNNMFKIYTGYSIIEYVRKKKLEYAISELKKDRKIIDIAVEIGYSSERSLSRALTNEYGHSSNYFRVHDITKIDKIIVKSMKLKFDNEKILTGFPPSFSAIEKSIKNKGVEKMKNFLSDVRYEIIEEMLVLSGTVFGKEPEDEIIGIMNKMAEFYDVEILRTFGFDSPVENTEDIMEFRGYEYWLYIDDSMLKKFPNREKFNFEGTDITIKKIPRYKYATLRIEDPFANPFERIPAGWSLLSGWIEENNNNEEKIKHNIQVNCLEEVKEINGVTVMDIYIPVF